MQHLLNPEQHWVCPNCNFKSVTHEAEIHTRYHDCRGMKGLSVPMIQAGVKAKVKSVEREDYIGQEEVQYDGDGRPVMKVIVEREDGYDTTVYAPMATAGGKTNS